MNKPSSKPDFNTKFLRNWLAFLSVIFISIILTGCISAPVGKARVELVDQLVTEQEFSRIQELLNDIDVKDPEFEALGIRRRAIRPLIAQFEQHTIKQVAALQARDLWPQALDMLKDARNKLPDSKVLQQAEADFFQQRAARLNAIQQQISLLEGQGQNEKMPLVDKVVAIHPTSIRTRWQHFQHRRKNKILVHDLMICGNQALEQQRLELAEACFAMVRALSVDMDNLSLQTNVETRLAAVAKQRQLHEQQAEEIAQATMDKQRRERERQILELKAQYHDLAEAGWLVAAKQTLVQLRLLSPDDEELRQWAGVLQVKIDLEVEWGIRRGQALYSRGQLEEALDAWEHAAQLDPDNPVLQRHIARAERFIHKLERLNHDKS